MRIRLTSRLRYICMVAATCMVLYGYDASVFNAAQGSANWLDYFDLHKKDDAYLIGLVNTAYTIGAIVGGFFMAGPLVSTLDLGLDTIYDGSYT